MRVITGHIAVSQLLLEASQESERRWKRLEWIAAHYDEATAEERADLDRTITAIRERDDSDV